MKIRNVSAEDKAAMKDICDKALNITRDTYIFEDDIVVFRVKFKNSDVPAFRHFLNNPHPTNHSAGRKLKGKWREFKGFFSRTFLISATVPDLLDIFTFAACVNSRVTIYPRGISLSGINRDPALWFEDTTKNKPIVNLIINANDEDCSTYGATIDIVPASSEAHQQLSALNRLRLRVYTKNNTAPTSAEYNSVLDEMGKDFIKALGKINKVFKYRSDNE